MSTSPADPAGPTGQLSTWISSTTLSSIPADAQERAKYLILDGLACALNGAQLPWTARAASTIFALDPAGNSTAIGWDRKTSPLSAALLNSASIQGFELDDWHSAAPLHSNSILLPALLAAVEHVQATEGSGRRFTGKDLLLAMIVGYEVGPRVGLALHGPHILTRGWHSGAVFGPAASAAAVSKLLGLPASQVEDALGTACTQAGGLMAAQFGSDAKRMQHGFAARNGLLAAFLAQGGYTGIKKVFEEKFGGYLSCFGQGSGMNPESKVEEIAKDLGETWQIWGVRVKPYAAMAGTHCTVDCIRALQENHADQLKDLSNIAQITIEMGEAAFHHGGWEPKRPLNSMGAQMSNAYVGATQLVDGEVTPAEFRHDLLERDELWDLIQKTTCKQSEEFTDQKLGQRVTIKFTNQQPELTQRLNGARGVSPPLSNEEIVEKWRIITKGVIDDKRRDEIEKLVLSLESLDELGGLIQLLSGSTRNPIA